eukprot:2409098-Pyramimonas_sp.AAC.1
MSNPTSDSAAALPIAVLIQKTPASLMIPAIFASTLRCAWQGAVPRARSPWQSAQDRRVGVARVAMQSLDLS